MAQQSKENGSEHREMTDDHANRLEQLELETKGI